MEDEEIALRLTEITHKKASMFTERIEVWNTYTYFLEKLENQKDEQDEKEDIESTCPEIPIGYHCPG